MVQWKKVGGKAQMRPHSPKRSIEIDVNCEPCIASSAYMVDHEAWKEEPLGLVRAQTPKSCSSDDEYGIARRAYVVDHNAWK